MNSATYTLAGDKSSITCTVCGRTSYHPKDVEELYCGNCKMFHQRHLADFEKLLIERFPWIDWHKPITVCVMDSKVPHLVCRICIARNGLKAGEVANWPTESDAFAKHMQEIHPVL